MKKLIFLRSVSLFLAFLILGSSVGVVINNHYCNLTKTLKQSVFSEKIDCDHKHQATTHSCSSCNNKCRQLPENKMHFEPAGCCVDYAVFLRLEEIFNVSDVYDQIFNCFLPVLSFFDFSEIICNKDSKLEPFIKRSPPLPPIFGKEKVIAFSQLKIDNLFLF
ncbi:MAG: hypothetical protein LBM67_09040 [Lentimicrobiaceae bacterium]|nr:hypothetical protein [Lentimicrobiaceae bacterium]